MCDLTTEQIIAALRCSASVLNSHECEGCPYLRQQTWNEEIFEDCDTDRIALDAADLLEAQERDEKNDPLTLEAYLPEKDLMPYDDLSITAAIQDATNNMLDQWEKAGDNCSPIGILNVNREWTRTISKALAVYKAVLLNVHGEPKENVT